jgi:hypothetical protein
MLRPNCFLISQMTQPPSPTEVNMGAVMQDMRASRFEDDPEIEALVE